MLGSQVAVLGIQAARRDLVGGSLIQALQIKA